MNQPAVSDAVRAPHAAPADVLEASDTFVRRHVAPREADVDGMLAAIDAGSLDALIDQTVPADIRLRSPLQLDGPRAEFETLAELRAIATKNRVLRSMIGQGYYDTITPPVIQRNVLENPGWYTQYTPYQAEISQGRLEALINFQTMVADLTGLPLANASLLDEATAAAEAMHMCHELCADGERRAFFVAADCHPQTIAVVQTRARALNLDIIVAGTDGFAAVANRCFGALLQYPATDGLIRDDAPLMAAAHAAGALAVVATDLLALTLLKPPGELGADIAIGSAQRFGVPLGFGGPHAAFIATKDEYKRQIPGRIIGVSRDAHGAPAYRLAIQTREQHIRREKATSNICTAQVLLAVMASMYAVYHGPDGLRRIARRIRGLTSLLGRILLQHGHEIPRAAFFDTLRIRPRSAAESVRAAAVARGVNLRDFGDGTLGVSVDETTTRETVADVLAAFGVDRPLEALAAAGVTADDVTVDARLARRSPFLTHPVFNAHHSEHEMLRYIRTLESRDLSLTSSMISLGSCTMKLNASAEMFPVSWPEFARLHPYAPAEQAVGYLEMCRQLEAWLAEITGFAAVSLQPNSGAQGEYAGLLAIRAYHERGQATGDRPAASGKRRSVCLIPVSAHGTNPASAVMAGFTVVAVKCDPQGNVDIADLRAKAAEHADDLGALMITYPSTHGVFEPGIREICAIVHQHGGLVYMDGANMNAQVGLTRPAEIGADVCHLNLHKTFCIPHGGGGPGMGPIAVAAPLAPFLPGDPLENPKSGIQQRPGPVSAAPYGSASILPISWMYIRMMGGTGLRRASEVAILNANYMAKRLEAHYPILYRGRNGRVAHEFIVDCRPFEASSGVKVEDIAKRLMDYGFHAPTMSFPVPGTLMIEPTESEPRAELDRFCDAMIAIRAEIRAIEQGRMDRADNPLKNAPHTAAAVCATEWLHPYPREQAAFPAPWVKAHKFWPPVGRVDNVWGDRNLFCTCVPLAAEG